MICIRKRRCWGRSFACFLHRLWLLLFLLFTPSQSISRRHELLPFLIHTGFTWFLVLFYLWFVSVRRKFLFWAFLLVCKELLIRRALSEMTEDKDGCSNTRNASYTAYTSNSDLPVLCSGTRMCLAGRRLLNCSSFMKLCSKRWTDWNRSQGFWRISNCSGRYWFFTAAIWITISNWRKTRRVLMITAFGRKECESYFYKDKQRYIKAKEAILFALIGSWLQERKKKKADIFIYIVSLFTVSRINNNKKEKEITKEKKIITQSNVGHILKWKLRNVKWELQLYSI